MKVSTSDGPVNTGESPARKQREAKSRKTEVLEVVIPRADLDTFITFANHFGFTPEVVIEVSLFAQLATMSDSLLLALAELDSSPPVEDPVTVVLNIIPAGMEVINFVTKTLRRPVGEIAAMCIRDDASLLANDMEEASGNGGFDSSENLDAVVQRVVTSETYFRRGLLPRERGKDAWDWLHIEDYRPSPSQSPEGKKGGAKP